MAKGPKDNKTSRSTSGGAFGKADARRIVPSPKTPRFWKKLRQKE